MEKSDDQKVADIITDLKQREKMYNEMSKEALVDLLVVRDMFEDSFEPDGNGTKLWYFVSDWSESKYLTNERPTKHVSNGREFWTSDGEINIRVPACMETILPNIKYGDEPVRVALTVSI